MDTARQASLTAGRTVDYSMIRVGQKPQGGTTAQTSWHLCYVTCTDHDIRAITRFRVQGFKVGYISWIQLSEFHLHHVTGHIHPRDTRYKYTADTLNIHISTSTTWQCRNRCDIQVSHAALLHVVEEAQEIPFVRPHPIVPAVNDINRSNLTRHLTSIPRTKSRHPSSVSSRCCTCCFNPLFSILSILTIP